MKKEVLKRSGVIMLLLTLVLTAIYVPVQASTVSTQNEIVTTSLTKETKATVATQKELDSALSNKTIVSITIKTDKKVKLTIGNKNYSTKRVYVKAPNSTITNKGKFKSVNVYVSNQQQLDNALSNTTTKATYITISTTKELTFNIPEKDFSKIGLIITSPNADIVNKAAFKTIHIKVSSQEQLDKALQMNGVTTISLITDEETEFVIKEGDYSNIKLIVDAPKAAVENRATFKDVSVTEGSSVNSSVITPTPTPTTESSNGGVSNGGGNTGGGSNGGSSTPSTPAPILTDPTTPVIPTPENPNVTLDELKTEYAGEIRKEADKLYNYMNYSEWNEFNNGIVNEWITRLNSYTVVQDLESNYPIILEAVHQRQQTTERFVNNDPMFMYAMTPEQLENDYSDCIVNGFYDFTTLSSYFGIEKHYYVSASDTSFVSNITFENATQTVTTGSAITYNVRAWNNINGAEDVVGIYVLEDSATPGQYTIGTELERNVHYQITDTAIIIDGSVTEGLDVGHYGFFIKTQVPYLSVNTGNYNYYNIVD